MADFKRERKSRFGDRDSRKEGRKFGERTFDKFQRRDGGRSRRNPDMERFTATCDQCGEECELPFKPTSGKPVYCSSCFRKKNDEGPRPSRGSSSGPSSDELHIINMKLDKIMKALKIQ